MLKIFLLLSFSLFTHSQDKCKTIILQSYNLDFFETPSDTEFLDMCPTVKKSCCKMEAQGQIFLWETKRKEIREFYSMQETLYNQVLDSFDAVSKIAEKILELQKKKQQGNCKFIAERIVSYNAEILKDSISKSLKKVGTFVENSLEGFYCSLCDFENHQFIDTEKSRIMYSENFCRNMIENTLGPLRYIQEHFINFATLTIGFMTKCNAKGEFLVSEQINPEGVFKMSDEHKAFVLKHLNCKENRNEKQWIGYCENICQSFTPTYYSELLSG